MVRRIRIALQKRDQTSVNAIKLESINSLSSSKAFHHKANFAIVFLQLSLMTPLTPLSKPVRGTYVALTLTHMTSHGKWALRFGKIKTKFSKILASISKYSGSH